MEYKVKTAGELPFWIGDKFYKVGRPISNAEFRFNANCPCCQNKGIIMARGANGAEYEVDCPVCIDKNHQYGYGINFITVTNWEVQEYIVHQAELENDEVISSIQKDFARYIKLSAFRKYGRCSQDYIIERVPTSETKYIDANLDDLTSDIKKIFEYRKVSNYIFRNKKDAKKFLRLVKDYDKKKLEEFNHKFNTAHEYPY